MIVSLRVLHSQLKATYRDKSVTDGYHPLVWNNSQTKGVELCKPRFPLCLSPIYSRAGTCGISCRILTITDLEMRVLNILGRSILTFNLRESQQSSRSRLC